MQNIKSLTNTELVVISRERGGTEGYSINRYQLLCIK